MRELFDFFGSHCRYSSQVNWFSLFLQRSALMGRENALPSGGVALNHARCQGRGVGVHRSAAKILDRRSAWSERSVSAGRAGEERKRSAEPVAGGSSRVRIARESESLIR